MKQEFPRLLVATEFPPNASGGGPAVVRQMLKGWPVERLSWWSCLPEQSERFGLKVAAHRVATIPTKLYPHRRLTRQKSWLLENIWTPWAARHFQKTLADQKPEVVWVIPHAWAISPLAKILPRAKIGYHVTVQDYADAGNGVAIYGASRSRWLAGLADQLYSQATSRDATSHPMIADLQARTGKAAAQMLHAGLEAEDFAFLENRGFTNDHEICIAHAGTIQAETEFSLFVAALARIRARLPRPVRLVFFGAHSYSGRPWFDSTWMEERGNLPEAELNRALRKCTWGFSLLPLGDFDSRYHRYSFPTKFITCLAAGLPVITLGHPESSVVKMAKLYGVGPCLTTSSLEEMQDILTEVLAIKNPWPQFGPAVLGCAQVEFDASRMRQKLRDCLWVCAQESRVAK